MVNGAVGSAYYPCRFKFHPCSDLSELQVGLEAQHAKKGITAKKHSNSRKGKTDFFSFSTVVCRNDKRLKFVLVSSTNPLPTRLLIGRNLLLLNRFSKK